MYTNILLFLLLIVIYFSHAEILSVDSTIGNGCIYKSVLKMEINNNRQLINSVKQLNPMPAAENVLSRRKISHRAN